MQIFKVSDRPRFSGLYQTRRDSKTFLRLGSFLVTHPLTLSSLLAMSVCGKDRHSCRD